MVGGQLEGGLRLRAGEPRHRADQLAQLQARQAQGADDPVPAVQDEAGPLVVPVQHRGVRPDRRRSATCETAPDRGGAHPRVHPQTRPARGARHRPDPLGDRVVPAGPLARRVLRGDHPPRPSPRPNPCPVGLSGGRGLGNQVAGGALSTGEVIPNPKHLDGALRALRRLQCQAARRTGPDKRTRQQPSARWRATQARITRLHTAVANARRDGLHKVFTRLIGEHATIVVEDLHVAGMVRNRRLARHVAGVGMAELRRQLAYKTGWSGIRLVVADRWYPSSKTCSDCGAVKAKLRLSERAFRCDQCGFTLDRDLNAARNSAALASTASCVGDENQCPLETHVRPALVRATGIATGSPCGQRRAARRGSRHGFTRFVNGVARVMPPKHRPAVRRAGPWETINACAS